MEYLLSALVFGLSAGFSPGPLLTLIILQTLQFGKQEGVKVAIAPLFTDFPIVLISVLVLARVSEVDAILGILSFLGGLYLGWLGYQSLRIQGVELNIESVKPQSYRKGIITNFLSPNPYMFWFSIGGPMTIEAYKASLFYMILFLCVFYFCLVGGKVLTAMIVGMSRQFLKSRLYIYINRFLGALLLLYACIFLWDAYRTLSAVIFGQAG